VIPHWLVPGVLAVTLVGVTGYDDGSRVDRLRDERHR
jgi:hypothetical protein